MVNKVCQDVKMFKMNKNFVCVDFVKKKRKFDFAHHRKHVRAIEAGLDSHLSCVNFFSGAKTFCFSLRVWVKDFRRTINSTVIPNSKKTLAKPITFLGSVLVLPSFFLVKSCKFLSTLKGRKARVKVIFWLVIPITQVNYIPQWNINLKSCPKVHFLVI